MKSILTTAALALGVALTSAPAFAGGGIPVPEPISMSLLAGGIGAIAVVRYLRRK
jgi:hypothetical protein